MSSLDLFGGGRYTILCTGLPVVPADPVVAANQPAWVGIPDSSPPWTWSITIASAEGTLQARSNPGVDHIYLYVYTTEVDALPAQEIWAIDLGTGGPVRDLGTSLTFVTLTATLNLANTRFAAGVYDNLRLSLTPVINVV